jgi:hypothetical protein
LLVLCSYFYVSFAHLSTHAFVDHKQKEDVVILDEVDESSSDKECISLIPIFYLST